MTPAEREARWRLCVRFAIEAASEDEARAVLGQALAGLKPELPLRGVPVIHPRHRCNPDDIWVPEVEPDLTHLQSIDPNDAQTRCRFVQSRFPMSVTWSCHSPSAPARACKRSTSASRSFGDHREGMT